MTTRKPARRRYFTQSELKTWRRCRRKWWLSQWRRLQYKPEFDTASAASLGSLVHTGLEALYTDDMDWRAVLADEKAKAEEIWAERPDDLAAWLKQYELAEIMIEGYEEWLAEDGADQWVETIGLEEKVEVKIGSVRRVKPRRETIDIWLLGKLDRRIRDLYDDTEGYIDFKTVGSLHEIPKRAPRDEQFLHYSLLQRLRDPEHRPPPGGIWRQLRKVKRTARANPPFYGEYRYRFNRQQLDSYERRVRFLIDEIMSFERRLELGEDPLDIMPPTPTRDCDWDCEFKNVCPMFDNGDRVEDYVADWYTEGDPLARYAEQEVEIK